VAGKSGTSQGSNDSSPTSEYRTCSSRFQEKTKRDPPANSEGPACSVMNRVKSRSYGACPIRIRTTDQRSAAPNTHYFSPSPLARERPRRVSSNRVRHERVSNYGTQPVPIVACAVWATGSPWYSPSTEGLVVRLHVLLRPAFNLVLALFSRRGTKRSEIQRERVKPCEIRERGTQRGCG
jgi:hypothetical protein